MTFRLLLGASFLPLLALACAATTDADAEDSAAAVTARWSPYPDAIRPMQKHEPLDPQNASIPFGDLIRDQGPIGSCASHGFVALLENQLFLERGIAVDLAERWQMYENFLETGNIGNTPDVIARYPSIVDRLGVMPEELYPYAGVAANAKRFEADAAQGLATDANEVTVDKAIAGTKDSSMARGEILRKAEYFGATPAGQYPVVIPVKAKLLPNAKVPEIEAFGKIAACFSEQGAAAEREDRRIAMTPREFAHYCLGVTPEPYFTCAPSLADAEKSVSATTPEPDATDCTATRAFFDKVATADVEAKDKLLALTTQLLDRNQAVVVGVSAPAQGGQFALWPTKLAPGSGHAVLALGYVTAEELADPAQQGKGLLASLFDTLETKLEPDYAQKRAAIASNDAAALRDLRVASKLGQYGTSEGGLVFFRNSWGAKVGDVEIGAGGYQTMTYAYFARSLLLVSSRKVNAVAGVTWSDASGVCPSQIDVRGDGAWFSRADKGKPEADLLWSQGKPAACAP